MGQWSSSQGEHRPDSSKNEVVNKSNSMLKAILISVGHIPSLVKRRLLVTFAFSPGGRGAVKAVRYDLLINIFVAELQALAFIRKTTGIV